MGREQYYINEIAEFVRNSIISYQKKGITGSDRLRVAIPEPIKNYIMQFYGNPRFETFMTVPIIASYTTEIVVFHIDAAPLFPERIEIYRFETKEIFKQEITIM